MEQLIFYLKLGFMHILDINAYDHFLFIVSITIPFSFRNFKRLFWIITFFYSWSFNIHYIIGFQDF
jgi:hypothetical protein